MKRKLIALLLTLALMLSVLSVAGIVPAGADGNYADASALLGSAKAALYQGYGEQSRKYLADRIQRYEAVLYNDVATEAELDEALAELQNAYDSLKPMHGYELVALNGFNAIIVCPSSVALQAYNLGGIEANFQSVSALPTGSALTADAKTMKYYLTADDGNFKAGDVVEWDAELNGWVKFEGLIR